MIGTLAIIGAAAVIWSLALLKWRELENGDSR